MLLLFWVYRSLAEIGNICNIGNREAFEELGDVDENVKKGIDFHFSF